MKAIHIRRGMAILAIGLAGNLGFMLEARGALTVEPGFDLWETAPGTEFMGIPFEGVPLSTTTGFTDTIVERLAPATVGSAPGTATIPIEMVALQLRSVDPVDFGAGTDFHFVTLDPTVSSLGTLEMTFDDMPEHRDPGDMPDDFPAGGGTFNSSISVNFDLRIGSLTGPIILSDTLDLKSSGSVWDHLPDAGDVLFRPGGLFPNFELNGMSSHRDFFPSLTVEEHPAGSETKHIARPATHAFSDDDPRLPPIGGGYLSATGVHALYSGPALELILRDPKHRPVAARLNGVVPIQGGEQDVFFSQFEATADILRAPGINEPLNGAVVTATGISAVNVFGRDQANQTGTYETQFVELTLQGVITHPELPPEGIPVDIQLSQGLPSPGQTTVTDLLNSNQFAVDSFFDIFTELTIPNPQDPSGPPLHAQSQQPARVHLETLGTDLNDDGITDNTDLGIGFGNFTNASDPLVNPQGKFHREGDVEGGDQDVDNSDLGMLFGDFGKTTIGPAPGEFAGTGSAGNLVDSSSRANLIYDASSGNVKLDASEAAGGVITNFVLKNAAGAPDFSAPGTAAFPFLSLFTTDTATEISQTDGSGLGFAGMHDLGNIFPTGLSLGDLEMFLTQASYVGVLGSGNPEFDLLPEPSTMALLAICLMGLSINRQRR